MLALHVEQGTSPPSSPETENEWQTPPNITSADVYDRGDLDEFRRYLTPIRISRIVHELCVPDNLIREIALFSLGRIVECCVDHCFEKSVLLHRDMHTYGENGLCDECGAWRCGYCYVTGECSQGGHYECAHTGSFLGLPKGMSQRDERRRLQSVIRAELRRWRPHTTCCSLIGECQNCGRSLCTRCMNGESDAFEEGLLAVIFCVSCKSSKRMYCTDCFYRHHCDNNVNWCNECHGGWVCSQCQTAAYRRCACYV